MLVSAGNLYEDVSLYFQTPCQRAANRGYLTVPAEVVSAGCQYGDMSLYLMESYQRATNIRISLCDGLSGISGSPIPPLSNVLSIILVGRRHTNGLAFHCHCNSVCHPLT